MTNGSEAIKENSRLIEVDGKKYRRHYYNTCVRCALSPERIGKACPVEACEDGTYYKEVKEIKED